MPIPTLPPPDLHAEDIFFKTRAVLGARAYPAAIRYSVKISGLSNGRWTRRTYRTSEEWPERSLFAHSISDEETANPVRPSNFCFYGIPPKKGFELPGVLGIPKLAITYMFGLAISPNATNPNAPAGSLRTIGTVRAVARVYDVRLAGEETIAGHTAYHLTLTPLGNPGRYRLRDMWVDESSYQLLQLVTDGNFTGKETGAGRWTVTYEQIGTRWYLADELSQGRVEDSTGTFEHVDVQFLDVVEDPRDNLDFGISSSNSSDTAIVEPADTFR